MAKTTKPDDKADAPRRHPREVAADLQQHRKDAAAMGLPIDAAAQFALLAEFADAVAATYTD